MFKKITGLVLGIALFTMCPLTAAAAPMVPAPYTADQLVDLSRAALAGVSSYHVDSVESTEFTYPATPQANFSYVETSQLTATPQLYILSGCGKCYHRRKYRDKNCGAVYLF